MSISRQRLQQIIKEEMSLHMSEMTDDVYNDQLQQRHGRFTSPENVHGTPEYKRRNAPTAPELPRSGPSALGGGGGGPIGGGWDYSEYDHLREMDDMDDEGMSMDMPDSDDDMGFDVVPDDETAMVPAGDDMGVDWSQFDAFDSDLVGSAFIQAGKDLAEENPEEAPTTEQLVARMLEILDEGEPDGDMDDEAQDMDAEEEEDEASGEEEGSLNEWIRRTNLLAGTRRRR
jgi:hypothetical protein